MKCKTSLSCAAALLLCLLAGSVMWAQSDQPSLADVAKQKSSAKAKRVVTNDEIPPSPEANNPPPASGSSASGATGPASGPKSDPKKPGEKPALSAEKQTKLQELMKEHDSLEKIIAQLQQQIESSNDPSRIANLSDVVKHAKENLAANQAEIDKLKASGADDNKQAAANPPAAPAPPPK